MAHNVEPMDIDNDFDNKENSVHNSNVYPRTPCTEKGYEELDVSELNMKLRYSVTPAASPMSKSYTANCVDNKNFESGDDYMNGNLTRSFNSGLPKTDNVNKSVKSLPLQPISTEQFVDKSRNASVLRSLDSTSSVNVGDVTITVSSNDNYEIPSSSSSAAQTPEAVTPTKEIPRTDGGSPIMRGLKSVLNMFRPSQSPIPPAESEGSVVKPVLSPADIISDVDLSKQSSQAVLASTPIASQKVKDSARRSPLKESIVFNEDLEKELMWKDETTIFFKEEKIPIHKLFYPTPTGPIKCSNNEKSQIEENPDVTVEYMDISCNDSVMADQTMTDIQTEQHQIVSESDGEFVDCETTFTNDKSVIDDKKDNKIVILDNNDEVHISKTDCLQSVHQNDETITVGNLTNPLSTSEINVELPVAGNMPANLTINLKDVDNCHSTLLPNVEIPVLPVDIPKVEEASSIEANLQEGIHQFLDNQHTENKEYKDVIEGLAEESIKTNQDSQDSSKNIGPLDSVEKILDTNIFESVPSPTQGYNEQKPINPVMEDNVELSNILPANIPLPPEDNFETEEPLQLSSIEEMQGKKTTNICIDNSINETLELETITHVDSVPIDPVTPTKDGENKETCTNVDTKAIGSDENESKLKDTLTNVLHIENTSEKELNIAQTVDDITQDIRTDIESIVNEAQNIIEERQKVQQVYENLQLNSNHYLDKETISLTIQNEELLNDANSGLMNTETLIQEVNDTQNYKNAPESNSNNEVKAYETFEYVSKATESVENVLKTNNDIELNSSHTNDIEFNTTKSNVNEFNTIKTEDNEMNTTQSKDTELDTTHTKDIDPNTSQVNENEFNINQTIEIAINKTQTKDIIGLNTTESKKAEMNNTQTREVELNTTETKEIDMNNTQTREVELNTTETKAVEMNNTQTREVELNTTETKEIEMNNTQTREVELNTTETKAVEMNNTQTREVELNTTETKEVEMNNTQTSEVELNTIETKAVEMNHTQTREVQLNTTETKEVEMNNTQTREVELNTTETKEIEMNNTQTKDIELNTTETKEIEINNTQAWEFEFNTTEGKKIKSNKTEAMEIDLDTTEIKDIELKNTSTNVTQPITETYCPNDVTVDNFDKKDLHNIQTLEGIINNDLQSALNESKQDPSKTVNSEKDPATTVQITTSISDIAQITGMAKTDLMPDVIPDAVVSNDPNYILVKSTKDAIEVKDNVIEIMSDTIKEVRPIENRGEENDLIVSETPTNEALFENKDELEINIDEEVILSESNSPFVSIDHEAGQAHAEPISLETCTPCQNKTTDSPPISPKITSKGYNFNFDEKDDPFATKTKIRQSPPPYSPKLDATERVKEIPSNQKDKNRRKSQPEQRKPVAQKNAINKTFSGAAKSSNRKSLKPAVSPASDTKNKDSINIKSEHADNIIAKTEDEMQLKTSNPCKVPTVHDEDKIVPENTTIILQNEAENVTGENKTSEETLTNSNEVKQTSSSEQSTYFSAETSAESVKTKNVFNIPEIDDINFNPFITKSKVRESPPRSNNSISDKQNSSQESCTINKASESLEDKDCGNISNLTCSSKTTDERDITVREIEVHTEDEDTLEGPFLESENIDIDDKISDFDGEDVDMMQFSELPTQSNEEQLEGGEMFIDAEAFEFLLNQNKTNVVADSGKESLFLKFDPLFAKRVSTDGVLAALNKVQKRQSTPKRISVAQQLDTTFEKPVPGPSNLNSTCKLNSTELVEESSEDINVTITKPMMVVTPAVNPITPRNKSLTPTSSNRRSITFTSPAIAVIDRLLSMSGNNSLLGHDNSMTQVSREQNEAEHALTQLRELLAEKEIQVYNLRSESKELKDRLSTLESQMRALESDGEERLRKINDLTEKLSEKTKINKSMAAVVEEYERTIASLIAESEQDKKRHNEERIKLIKERDEQTAHLASMEVSFSDLHSKYEKSKQIILTCKANEDAYKKSIKDFEENLSKMQSNYELLKQHATSKLNHANQELEKMNKSHEAEVLKLNAMIKRKELHITSLEETLIQKTKANEELTMICDELINKVA